MSGIQRILCKSICYSLCCPERVPQRAGGKALKDDECGLETVRLSPISPQDPEKQENQENHYHEI